MSVCYALCSHPKFTLRFADEKEQEHLASLIPVRMRIDNGLLDENVHFDVPIDEFPDEDDSRWQFIHGRDLESYRTSWNLPTLSSGNIKALINMSLGNITYKCFLPSDESVQMFQEHIGTGVELPILRIHGPTKFSRSPMHSKVLRTFSKP